MPPGPCTVEITEDAAAFLAAAGDHLALDPVLSTVVSSVAQRTVAAQAVEAPGAEPPRHPRWFAVVRREGAVVGAAMRTAPFEPFPMFVLPMTDDAARALAVAVQGRGERVDAANGALPAARVLLEALAADQGGAVRAGVHTRLFELGELVVPPDPPGRLRRATAAEEPLVPPDPPGRLRRATAAEEPLVLGWFDAFGAEADAQAGRHGERAAFHTAEDIALRVAEGRIWVWEDRSGRPVHLTGHSVPSYGVSRIGPVFTPREHRGRGYASAAVAGVSAMLQGSGARVCLFTDQANPVSNKVYEALGFRPVVDMAELSVVGAGAARP